MAIPRQKITFPLFNLKDLFSCCVKDLDKDVEDEFKRCFSLTKSRVVLTNSSRDSFYFILSHLRKHLKKNKVLISAFNFSLMKQIIKSSGFEPLFVDSDIKSSNISEKDLFKKIDDDCGIVILTNLLGRPLDNNLFDKLKKKGLIIIEDCAHLSIPILHKSLQDHSGSLVPGSLGDISIFSFNFSKPLPSLYGAAIAINNNAVDGLPQKIYDIKSKLFRTDSFIEFKYLAKMYISSLIFSRAIFNLFVWPFLKFSFFLGFNRDLLDFLSKDDEIYVPKKITFLNKLSLVILKYNLINLPPRSSILAEIQGLYDQKTNFSNKKCEHKFIRYLYQVLVKDLRESKKIFIRNNIDLKLRYCVDISEGLCKNACYLEKHSIYLPFYTSLKKKEVNKILSLLLNHNLLVVKNE